MDTPATVVDLHLAETHFFELIERAHAGEEIIIARDGKPYARLVPLEPATKRQIAFAGTPLDDASFEPLPEDDLADWG
jgi:prevent-host-death family protein